MDVRDDLVDEVRRYFVGPYEEGEIFDDFPEDRYVSGLLFPRDTVQGQEDMEEMAEGDDGGNEAGGGSHESRSRIHMLQNSIGIRCEIPGNATLVTAKISYAKYRWDDQTKWNREPATTREVMIDTDSGSDGKAVIADADGGDESSVTWVTADVHGGPVSTKTLSVFLANEMQRPKNDGSAKYVDVKRDLNRRILFQPSITLHLGDGGYFLVSASRSPKTQSDEDRSLDLLFRDKKAFAQGYNCAASWDTSDPRPLFIRTEIVPAYNSKKILFSSEDDPTHPCQIDMVEMDMADTPKALAALLRPLVSGYEGWVESTFDDQNIPDGHDAVDLNRERSSEALERMKSGLDLLSDNRHSEVFEAFRLANRAMLYQIARHEYALSKHKGDKVQEPDLTAKGRYFWRPFQVAFLLINLRSMVDGDGDVGRRDRETVDLLWFPTGGGKTEAYMALSAFTLILRRIMWGEGGAGTAVIMRYTLRLLTLQQFERVATMVCALEKIRKDARGRLGTEPFLLGLWIGGDYTPNSTHASREAIREMKNVGWNTSGTPAQLNFCPWCGTDIWCGQDRCDYVCDKATGWTLVHCSNRRCLFSSEQRDREFAIPVVVVDEDIYRRCPSILISTVDKFAGLAWNPEMSSLFGRVDQKCRHGVFSQGSEHAVKYKECKKAESHDRYRSPDLIVQDELHLISGPLGTIAGLYETAVGMLCTEDGRGPKIVVSTATIRGVEYQVKQLYDRDRVLTFPPPAIDHEDSFFWWYTDLPGRRYVGLSYSHRSMKFVLGKLYASLLQRVGELRGTKGDALDPYWTLVAYFNSIRELGGALRLAEDDVVSNIKQIVRILPSHRDRQPRSNLNTDELTGRRRGSDLKRLRKTLEQTMNSDHSIDMLLATSMISVGVDINRMGMMVIDGQPKNFSEYIQVTGRIGRRDDIPGLVFTVFNPYKPRDLSHYEDFMGIHMIMQKCVEPAGITPFSDKAMERALHAVFIALVRMAVHRWARNGDASKFDPTDDEMLEIVEWIERRYKSVQDHDPESGESRAGRMLQQLCDNWAKYVEDHADLICYAESDARTRNPKDKRFPLMTDFGKRPEGEMGGFPIETPRAFRDVEPGAKLFYVGGS